MGRNTSPPLKAGSRDASQVVSHFIGRQPIFDLHGRVVAYELLFRCDEDDHCPASNADVATLTTIDRSLNIIGLKAMVGRHQAFINVTRELLVSETLRMLPPKQVVIEVLESIEADDQVLAALDELKKAGFTIALDDFELTPRTAPLVAKADLIKIDLMAQGIEGCRRLIEATKRPGLKFLAEKVESQDDFIRMKQLGCTLFQGYFFARPQLVPARRMGTGQLQSTRLMELLSQPTINLESAEQALRQDVTLSVKLLTYLNSAALGLVHEVTSIRHAVTLLGENKLRHWIAVVAMTVMIDDKPTELAKLSMIRGRFLESLCDLVQLKIEGVDPFLFGLFSLVDAMTDQMMSIAVDQLALTQAMKDALLGKNEKLKKALHLARCCETGSWSEADGIARGLAIDPIIIAQHYRHAMNWADRAFSSNR